MHLPHIDSETGYDDFDPRDEPEPEEEPLLETEPDIDVKPMPIIHATSTRTRAKKTA